MENSDMDVDTKIVNHRKILRKKKKATTY